MRNSKLIKRSVLFDKYRKKFIVDDLQMSDGSANFWAYISSPPGIIIVALDKDKNLVLVRQYRYTQKGFTYEDPAGAVDENENFLSTAKRELFEESGYRSDTFIDLGSYHTLSNETDHRCQIYLATNCQYVSAPSLDPYAEKYCELTTELHPFIEIYNSLGKPDSLIKDTEHVAAIFLTHRYLTDHNLL
jgi:ADP-ribose pyrophosphatase